LYIWKSSLWGSSIPIYLRKSLSNIHEEQINPEEPREKNRYFDFNQ